MKLEEVADQLLEAAKLNQAILEEPERLIIGLPNFAPIMGERLKNSVEAELFKGEKLAAQQLVAFAPRLFGSTSFYTKEVRALLSSFEKIEEIKERRSVEELEKLYRLVSSSSLSEALRLQTLQYIDTLLLENVANSELETVKSLALLRRLKYEPTNKSVLTAALRKLWDSLDNKKKAAGITASVLEDPLLSSYLEEKSKDSSSIQLLVKRLNKIHLFAALRSKDSAQSEKLLGEFREKFPEAKELEFTQELISESVNTGKVVLARRLITELDTQGKLSFSERAKYYFDGLYAGGVLPLFIFFGLFLLLGVLFFFVLGKVFPQFSWGLLSSRLAGSAKGRQRRKKEKAGMGYLSEVESEDEYSKLLAKFGLDDSATEADIKKAYRSLMKQHHPDAHGADGTIKDEDGLTDRTFEELKAAYDRLISMRSSYFGR